MKTNRDHEDSAGLDKVLKGWSMDVPLPARFQERVWQRIGEAENRREPVASGWVKRLIEVVVPRPQFAYAYVTVLVLAGMAAGSVTAQVKTHRMESELSARYVESVTPYLAANQP